MLGDNVLSQDALYAFQLNVGYNFTHNPWLSVGVRQTTGRRTTLNGSECDDPIENTRAGIVFGLPIASRQPMKLLGTTGLHTTGGSDFDTLVLQWACV